MSFSVVTCPFFQHHRSHFCAVIASQPHHPRAAAGSVGHPPQCESGSFICCPLYEHVQRRLDAVHRQRQGWWPAPEPAFELAS